MWIGPVFFDVERRELRSEVGVTRLGYMQSVVLAAMIRSGGNGVRERLAPPHASPKSVDVTVHRLRRKLAPHGIQIETQWGVGWRLVVPGAPERCPVCGTVIRRDP